MHVLRHTASAQSILCSVLLSSDSALFAELGYLTDTDELQWDVASETHVSLHGAVSLPGAFQVHPEDCWKGQDNRVGRYVALREGQWT